MRRIRFRRKRNRRVWGLAFPDEWRIELAPDMDDKTELEIAVHEVVHVIAPELDEETVDNVIHYVSPVGE